MDVEDTIFMLAGPVKIHPRVLRAMSVPSMAHRAPEFSQILADIRERLKYVFQTSGEVAVLSGSGTAGVESMISSLLRKEDKVLCISNGKFGERLYELCKIFSKPSLLEFPWGKPALPEKVAEALEGGDYAAVTLCHNETSTAVTNPAREIGQLAKKHGVLFFVDGITSVAGMEVKPDEWGIDAIVLGSQKCLAAPAGLSAAALSKRASESLHSETSYYLNLKKHVEKLKVGDTPYTPAIPLFLAFREALIMLEEEGLENRIERTRRLANATRDAVDALGLKLFPERSCASNTLTAIWHPENIDDGKFRKELKERHRVIIAGAQDKIKGRVFRIGHMGICSFGDLMATFGAIEATLDRMGYSFEKGAGLEAVARYM